MIAVSLIGHGVGSFVLGRALLGMHSADRSTVETMVFSLLLGMSAESFLVASAIIMGFPLSVAAWCAILAWLVSAVVCMRRGHLRCARVRLPRPRWFELGVLLIVVERVAFAIWQITRTPIVFDDTLTHWSGRARSLFGGVNWSTWPDSPLFLARHIGFAGYPLQIPTWRAISAWLAGGWNDVAARADGVLFFLAVVATVWSIVCRLTRCRSLAAGATFAVTTIPLLAYHAGAGYADIAVAAYACAALGCVLSREPMLAGFLAAAMCWVKNDGLVLVVPALLAATAFLREVDACGEEVPAWRLRWRPPARFLLGLSTIAPWLLFNGAYRLGLTPHTGDYRFRPDAPRLLWDSVVLGSAQGLFWILVLVSAAVTGRALARTGSGQAALIHLFVSLAGIAALFSCTAAFEFLANQMTIQRVMLQHAPAAAVVAALGLSAAVRWEESEPEGRTFSSQSLNENVIAR